MEVININVNQLTPYENNPRNNNEAIQYVANSIKEFGFKVPLVIDSDNVVICGHTRLLAAKQLGMEEVPCIVADDLTDEQIKAFRLADNKVAEMCCKRLQLQEKIGEDIAEVISIATGSDDVIVHITSKHSCVTARGVKSRGSSTTTTTKKGKFTSDYDLTREFINGLK